MARAARQFHCVLYADKGSKILLLWALPPRLFAVKNVRHQIIRYTGVGSEAKMETNNGEYGFVLEGGLNYSLSKHLEVALGCRYYAVQHSTKILSAYGPTDSSWFVKRVMPGLSMGWKF